MNRWLSAIHSILRSPVLGLSIVALTLCSTTTLAADFADLAAEQKPAWVAQRVEQLGAASREARTRAARELLQAGPEVASFLPTDDEIDDVAIADTLARIRRRIGFEKAVESISGTSLHLPGDATLSQHLASLYRQTGLQIVPRGYTPEMLATPVPLSATDAPFWQSIDTLATAAGFEYELKPGPTLMLSPALDSDVRQHLARADRTGPFRIVVDSLRRQPQIGGNRQDLLRVKWSLMVEPSLMPLTAKVSGNDLRVTTSAGQPLQSFDPAARLDRTYGTEERTLSFRTDYLLPADVPPADAFQFSGRMSVQFTAAPETFTWNLARGLTEEPLRRGQVEVQLRRVHSDIGPDGTSTLQTRLAIRFVASPIPFESHRLWPLQNPAVLQLFDGTTITHDGRPLAQLQQQGGLSITYRFEKVQLVQVEQFQYTTPTQLLDVPLTFEIQNLSLDQPEQE